MKPNVPKLRWPNLSAVTRWYIVRDDRGRYGVARYDPVYHADVLFAHPVEVPKVIIAGDPVLVGLVWADTLPAGAIVLADTPWHFDEELGTWRGAWVDEPDRTRTLEIVDDLGWQMPDSMAERVCHHPGGVPEDALINIRQAADYCRELGEPVSERGLRKACARGYIPGARRVGRDWVMTYRSINHYLDNRSRRGRKKIE